MARVVIIGPAHPLRGGLATFNQRLALEFLQQGHPCELFSFSLQYPSFMFPGTTQYTDDPAPENLKIHSVINSVNPLNWLRIGNRLRKLRPDVIVVRFWLPVMGPALGTILRLARLNKHTRVVCIADNVIPHEKRFGDKPFTRYFLPSCDGFITMSEKVQQDLRSFVTNKPVQLVRHPLYDNFGEPVTKTNARLHLGLPVGQRIVLFFGFIRQYKGLDLLLDAVAMLKEKGEEVHLLVAGEFYEDADKYRQQIRSLGIEDCLYLRTDFIADNEVKYYLCAADAVIQPYKNATQSGVTPLAYHFEKPMIVTNVGGLPALVPDGKVGIVVEPEAGAIADGIRRYYQAGEEFYLPHLRAEKAGYSWGNVVEAVLDLAEMQA